MKKYIPFFLFIIGAFIQSKSDYFVDVKNPFHNEFISTSSEDLQKICKHTLEFISANENSKTFPRNSIYLAMPFKDVKDTLSFIYWVIEHDKGKSKQRILDPDFLNKHFIIKKWIPDIKTASLHSISLPANNIRLTKYLIFKVKGSYKKTKEFNCALYGVPLDEKNLTEAQIEKKKNSLIRYKYTKQDILNGVLEKRKRHVKPLVWLTREGLEEALMQGSVYVTMPDGKFQIFNVDKNNGIPYDKTLKNKYLQKRYWYFKRVDGFLGYGEHNKVSIIPNVTFAGDVHSLGLGKVIVLRYTHPKTKKNEIKLGVLADTGGAFEKNLYQLDFFVGPFESRSDFKNYIQNLPTTAEAYLLFKRKV